MRYQQAVVSVIYSFPFSAQFCLRILPFSHSHPPISPLRNLFHERPRLRICRHRITSPTRPPLKGMVNDEDIKVTYPKNGIGIPLKIKDSPLSCRGSCFPVPYLPMICIYTLFVSEEPVVLIHLRFSHPHFSEEDVSARLFCIQDFPKVIWFGFIADLRVGSFLFLAEMECKIGNESSRTDPTRR